MASFSSTYPAQRPIFSLDAANAGRLDPRCSFTRSDTPPTYAAPSAVHYWSNEKHESSQNLVLQSQSFDTTWTQYQLASSGGLTGSQSAPDGTTTAWLVTAGTLSPGAPFLNQALSGIASSTEYTASVYLKAGTASHGYITLRGQFSHLAWAEIDFASPLSPTTGGANFTSISATSTAVGSTGWYRLTLTCTTSAVASPKAYVGPSDGTDPGLYGEAVWNCAGETIYVWGYQLEERGSATAYNATTTSIHRAYAPTLKSVTTAGQPRFEYDPATDGQSAAKGILIEGQSQNLFAYSDDFANQWTKTRTLASESAAVGPTGALDADLIYADGTAADSHFLYSSCTVTAASHTFSVYAKFAGVQYIQLQHRVTGAGSAQFDLVNGTYVAYNATGAMEPVGNGWYRCSVTETQSAGTAFARIWLMGGSGVGDYNWDGDSYSGVLLYGAQYEQNSFPSSLISSNGSATTRAAEQLSVATADIGYTGGPFTIVSETAGGQGYYPRAFTLTNGNLSNRVVVYRDSSSASGSTNWLAYCESDGSFQGALTIPSSASAGKLAVSYNTNDVSVCASGGTVATDSSAVISDALTTLRIGTNYIGAEQLNGHCKRIAIYNEALSDTNLQALTS